MKRVTVILTIGLLGFMVIGSDLQSAAPAPAKISKKSCRGYTVIESSRGIDCNGDTIRLVRTAGFYERVREDTPPA